MRYLFLFLSLALANDADLIIRHVPQPQGRIKVRLESEYKTRVLKIEGANQIESHQNEVLLEPGAKNAVITLQVQLENDDGTPHGIPITKRITMMHHPSWYFYTIGTVAVVGAIAFVVGMLFVYKSSVTPKGQITYDFKTGKSVDRTKEQYEKMATNLGWIQKTI